ncbi:target of Nesh-SH3-like isoform X1 [Saccostrea cucullata]|uniref:target of Nesh-SH3-like isoform X1 n=1 Tax=Saccostrea cuccullata TaxID=36930 RepID=UPI002ED671A4
MMFSHCTILWTLFAVVDSHSPLTEKKAEDDIIVKKEIVINNLQNQINQETVIRLSLLKQVYSLVNDMINVKNEMAAMKTNAAEIRKSYDDLRDEDKKMLNEIEQMKHDHNDTSVSLMNVHHEYNKKLSEMEQMMKINHNDTSKKIVNVRNDLLNVTKSVGLLRNYTDEIKAQYDIQEKRMKKLFKKQEKIQSSLGDLHNEDKKILSETQRMIANHSKNTYEKIWKMKEDLEQNITSMINKLPLTKQDCLESSNCWLQYSFEYDDSWNGCEDGAQYVKKTNYSSTPYLGVMTCSSTRYKLFLSKTLTGRFYNIADRAGTGDDHCELLGTTQSGVLPKDYAKSPNTQGFYRRNRGEAFSFGAIGYTPNQTSNWYEKWIECGVNITGNDRVIPV